MNRINNTWVFGNNAGLDFTTASNPGPPPIAIDGFNINTREGCASISDNSGNLLMYTDGSTIWDGSNTVQATGLNGNNSSTQSAVIVPRPGSTTDYYVFTTDVTGNNSHLDGRLVNTSNASWTVSNLNGLPLPNVGFSATEKLTVIKHANCVDFWIITIVQEQNTNNLGAFQIFNLDATSGLNINSPFLIPMNRPVADEGYLRVSPDGSMIALANLTSPGTIYLYPFNNVTGVVDISNLVVYNAPPTPNVPRHGRACYGVEFSPDSKLLYFTVIGGRIATVPVNNGYLYQTDLTNAPPLELVEYIDVDSADTNRYSLGALALGPDNRIYIAKGGESELGAILNPNVAGLGANVNMNFITLLSTSVCDLGLPNLVSNICIADTCEATLAHVEDIISERCNAFVNKLEHCDDTNDCECSDNIECKFLDVPAIKPCISIRWGDSDCDGLETDDFQVMCISVCNCYSNLYFRNFSITMLEVVDQNGDPVQTLPDGSASVQIYPIGPHCFGDIPPCGGEVPNCVTREFVVKTCGAVDGDYEIRLSGICFDVAAHINTSDCLKLTLCKS